MRSSVHTSSACSHHRLSSCLIAGMASRCISARLLRSGPAQPNFRELAIFRAEPVLTRLTAGVLQISARAMARVAAAALCVLLAVSGVLLPLPITAQLAVSCDCHISVGLPASRLELLLVPLRTSCCTSALAQWQSVMQELQLRDFPPTLLMPPALPQMLRHWRLSHLWLLRQAQVALLSAMWDAPPSCNT